MADDLRERVARAIERADGGYSIQLVKLVDGVSTYELRYDNDPEVREFPCHAEASDYILSRRRLDRADAAISACDPIDTATGLTWKERFLERAERCAQVEVERDTLKARYATPAGHPHRTPQEWEQLLDGRDKFIVEKGLFAEFVKSTPVPIPPDKRQTKERRVADFGVRVRGIATCGRPAPQTPVRTGIDRRRKAQPETSEVG